MNFDILFRRSDSEKGRMIYERNKQTAGALGVSWSEFYESDISTIDAIKDALAKTDVLLYVDENGLIEPGNPNVAQECAALLGTEAALFCCDVGSEEERWNPKKMSAAQGVFRNKPETFAFLDAWGTAYERRKAENNDRLTLQRALNDVRESGTAARLDEYYRLAGTYGKIVAQTYYYPVRAAEDAIARFNALLEGSLTERANNVSGDPPEDALAPKTTNVSGEPPEDALAPKKDVPKTKKGRKNERI